MTTTNLQVRRATAEDLPKLLTLWKEEGLPCEDLETRFTEFQVVEGEGGELLGAFALQIQELQGLIHSEAFIRPELADRVRDKLWERAQIQARNHGLVRMWTQLAAPFWHTNGFQPASNELLGKRPAGFPDEARPWLVLPMREEPVSPALSIDKEFALFKEVEKNQRERIFRQARLLKTVAIAITLAVLTFVAVMSIRLFLKQYRLPGSPPTASGTANP